MLFSKYRAIPNGLKHQNSLTKPKVLRRHCFLVRLFPGEIVAREIVLPMEIANRLWLDIVDFWVMQVLMAIESYNLAPPA